MLLNLGLSGFALSGADVGGFIGTPQPDLLTKWVELGAFQPIDRDHTNDTSAYQEVWVHGPTQEEIRRRYIEERYKLMSYLYTTTEEMTRTGIPIVRPLFLEFPDATTDLHPIDIEAGNEFLFGRDLLVAPAPYPDRLDSYIVELPSVNWYNYWTGEAIVPKSKQPDALSTTGEHGSLPNQITIDPRLDTLPVFVREGSIIPIQPLIQNTNEKPQGPLTLRVYPGKNCMGSIYLDDGNTFAYRQGDFLRMNITCKVDGHNLAVHIGAHQGSYKAWWKNIRVEVYGSDAVPQKSTLAGQIEPLHSDFDAAHHVASLSLPDDGHGADIHMQWSQ